VRNHNLVLTGLAEASCLWLQVVAVYTAQTALFKTINLFAPEKALVSAERTKGSYGAAPYFLSKVLADLPVAALYPFVFSSIVYPMANLQPKVFIPSMP
jgi:hypothetical protein